MCHIQVFFQMDVILGRVGDPRAHEPFSGQQMVVILLSFLLRRLKAAKIHIVKKD